MASNGDVKVIRPDEARAIHWLGSKGTFFATAADTGGAYALWLDEPPAGGGPVPHVHTRDDEFFYVLEGQLTYWCDGKSFDAAPGAFVGLPKGLGHQFRNVGKGPSRILIFTVPGGGEGFFLELGNPYSEPTDATVPIDPVKIEAASDKYGQRVVKPSLLHPVPQPEGGNLPLGVGRAAVLRGPGEGDAYAAGDALLTLKAFGPQTLGAYSMTEVALPARASFPAHRHARYSEGLYVVEGELSVQAGGPAVVAKAGSFVIVPPGAAHALTNPADAPARVLSLTVPAGIEDFYRSACRPVLRPDAPPPASPADAARLAELGPQFGVEFV